MSRITWTPSWLRARTLTMAWTAVSTTRTYLESLDAYLTKLSLDDVASVRANDRTAAMWAATALATKESKANMEREVRVYTPSLL